MTRVENLRRATRIGTALAISTLGLSADQARAANPNFWKSEPLRTYNYLGQQADPVNLVIVGSQTQVQRDFTQAGWLIADSGVINRGKAILDACEGKRYDAAPLSDQFIPHGVKYPGLPQKIGFEIPGPTNDSRHHFRLWPASVADPDTGKTMWIGAATYDDKLQLPSPIKALCKIKMAAEGILPTHHEAPKVDDERTYVANTMKSANETTMVQIVPATGKPYCSTFANGDNFCTDGNRVRLVLK